MKNVIYFCIGFMLLLIYRKYRERKGLLKPTKNNVSGASTGTGAGTTVRSWKKEEKENEKDKDTAPVNGYYEDGRFRRV